MEAMRDLARRLEAAGHGARTTLIAEAAGHYGISQQTLYRKLGEVGWTSGRKARADKGTTSVSESALVALAGMQKVAVRDNGKQTLHTPLAVSLAETSHIDVPVSSAQVNRLLRARKQDVKSQQMERPVTDLRAPYPNHTHQVDPSLCLVYYLRGHQYIMEERKFYKNKLENFAKVKLKVWRYTGYEKASGIVGVRYFEAAGENQRNLFDFLTWLWSKKPEISWWGVPKVLLWDKGSANSAGAIQNFLQALEVNAIAHEAGNSRAKGGVENANNLVETQFESRLRFDPVDSVEELNAAATLWQEAYNANNLPRLDTRIRREGIPPAARYALWQKIRAEQLRELPDIELCRAYLLGKEDTRKVRPNLTITFRHPQGDSARTYDVDALPGVVAGCEVTVFEALHVVGGVLQYGIPSFRLPRNIIDREVSGLRDLGVQFDTNKVVGKTFTIDQLMKDRGFDSVYIATGAGAPSFLGIPGEHAGQVLSANEFLTRINLMGGNKFPYLDTPVAKSQSVIVIGAGNTAMDCLRVAKRVGVPKVTCVYRRSEAEAPARIEELRHAKEEGIEFRFLHAPVEIRLDEAGNVTAMKTEVCELGEPDERGRRKPVGTGVFEDIACDTVIYALGTNANPIIGQSAPDLSLNKWGYIVAEPETQATNLPGVFAGGDIVTGGATVILAMGAGRRAAKAIGAYLASGDGYDARTWPITAEMADEFVSPVLVGSVDSAPAPAGESLSEVSAATLGAEVPAPQDEAPSPAATAPGDAPAPTPVEEAAMESHLLCPKCQQPLDGDESYICCAGQTLTWRCDSCGKVSEGFAFPYGQCPMCQGTLVRDAGAGPIDEDNEKAMEAIRTAFEIELGGGAYYRKAAEEANEPVLKDLFSRMSEMEDEHLETLQRRYHAEVPAPSPDFETTRAAIYAGLDHHPEDPANLLRVAIGFEKRAVDFFSKHMEECPEGSVERELYEELAAEEREHVALLTTELERFQSGKAGIL